MTGKPLHLEASSTIFTVEDAIAKFDGYRRRRGNQGVDGNIGSLSSIAGKNAVADETMLDNFIRIIGLKVQSRLGGRARSAFEEAMFQEQTRSGNDAAPLAAMAVDGAMANGNPFAGLVLLRIGRPHVNAIPAAAVDAKAFDGDVARTQQVEGMAPFADCVLLFAHHPGRSISDQADSLGFGKGKKAIPFGGESSLARAQNATRHENQRTVVPAKKKRAGFPTPGTGRKDQGIRLAVEKRLQGRSGVAIRRLPGQEQFNVGNCGTQP